MAADIASANDPLHIATQLAELIGQLQHLIDLAEIAAGRNVYDPLIVDLSAGQTQTINPPAEAHQLEALQVSSDTAATIQLYRIDQVSGPSGALIAQLYVPAGDVTPPLQLRCPIHPMSQLKIVSSAAIAHGAVVMALSRTRTGGYPYAG